MGGILTNMNKTATFTETNTTSESFVAYGPFTQGGKIHRTKTGYADCLGFVNTGKRVYRFNVKLDTTWADGFNYVTSTDEEVAAHRATIAANELAALAEANIPLGNLCKKCSGHLIAAS